MISPLPFQNRKKKIKEGKLDRRKGTNIDHLRQLFFTQIISCDLFDDSRLVEIETQKETCPVANRV